jgi:hypothetical protein
MTLILSYIDRKGGHITMPILPNEVEDWLRRLCKRRCAAVLRDKNNWDNEYGWVYKHNEAGWTWGFDHDILN